MKVTIEFTTGKKVDLTGAELRELLGQQQQPAYIWQLSQPSPLMQRPMRRMDEQTTWGPFVPTCSFQGSVGGNTQ